MNCLQTAVVLLAGLACWPTSAAAEEPKKRPCDAATTFTDATSVCWDEGDVQQTASTNANVELEPFCAGEGICIEACQADGQPGTRYWVVVDGKIDGQACLVSPEPGDEEVTPDRVLRAFQRLEWPSSELIIQPPDGQTLVNFETNFLTENTEPLRQQVTLLGQGITIEAWPESYTWEFGDGESLTTESAGARYPHLEVTHRYLQKDSFAPRVATTYAGRYRVEGGPWVDIPGTHTVAGGAVDLDVIEARPVLVAPDGG